jgi:NADH-quinone oxidoreductase subunit E
VSARVGPIPGSSPDALSQLVRRFEHGSRVPGWDEAADLTKDPAVVPDLATTPVPDDLRVLIEDYMARYPDRRSASIPSLRAAQRLHGWLSPTAIEQVAAVMRLTPGYCIAVASFYDMFEHRPVGPNTVYVCTNISCSLRGADRIYEAMQDAAGGDARFNIRGFECLGACDIAPMASVNSVYVGPLSLEDCPTLIEQLRNGEEPLPEKQLARMPVASTWWKSGGGLAGEPPGGRAAEGRTASQSDEKAGPTGGQIDEKDDR